MTERLDLVVLPAIAGHAHALGADGQPTCGCVARVQSFMLTAAARALRYESKCDVGADVPGGGAA